MSDLVERLRCQHTMSMFVTKDSLIACLNKQREEAATALTAKDKEIAEWKELAERSTRRLAELAEPGSIGAFAARDYWKARAETAERERDEAQFGFEHELRIKKELACALRKAERERDEARAAVKMAVDHISNRAIIEQGE